MTNFDQARAHMVDNQLRTSGITDWRILAQMSAVPRELFVTPGRRPVAYIDDVQWLERNGSGRFIAPPATFAKLLQLADVTPADTVLDVGAGSGYSTVIIAGLAQSVVGLEASAELAAAARENLAGLSIGNARIVAGDANQLGHERFDVILLEGSLDSIPPILLSLLNDGGRLVALIRRGSVAVASVFVRSGGDIAARDEFNAWLPPLFAVNAADEFVF